MTIIAEIFRPAVFSRRTRIAVLAAAAAGLAACGPDGPPPYYLYPVGPCVSDLQCAYGSYCVDPGPGMCVVPCRSNIDCGPGYACQPKKRRGTSGKVSVCWAP